ncbi:hypothetical protein [Aneurinibacillus tyrosinisolvens]|uniref:hypothetical protein n=1 Tax=Aneurinibacillus tyrosinisolvens TaxID=1443435 RepID=UPI00063FB385|nr:hypothetical protein [Aneurinibacillus tyrosinisolvens]
MAKEISIDLNKVRSMADDFVREITQLESLTRHLNKQMRDLLYYIEDPQYIGCMAGVLASDSTREAGNRLVHRLSENEIYIRKTARRIEQEDSILGNLLKFNNKISGLAQAGGHAAFNLIDHSQFCHVARGLQSPKYFLQYKDKPLKELVYKHGTRFLPGDILGFTMKEGMSAVKSHVGNLLKQGKR